MEKIPSFSEFLNESDKSQWEKLSNENDIKSDIYTLFKRKTKINDIVSRIIKDNPGVTKQMIQNLVFDYKNDEKKY